jgi:hypothetical protein
MTDLTVSKSNEYKILSRLDGLPFGEPLKPVIPAIAKRDYNLREVVSNFQRFSFSLRCLATGNTFRDLKFSSYSKTNQMHQFIKLFILA